MSKKPRILFFDVETGAALGYYWASRKYDQTIIDNSKEAEMLSFAYKFQDKKRVTGVSQETAGSYKKMVKEMHPIFNEMDYLVGHNVNKFDRRWCNTTFGKFGLTKPSPYKITDTLTVMKQNFYLPSYKLDDCAEFFGIETRKKKIGWEIWRGCMDGEKECFEILLDYNKQDVRVLEALYNELVKGGWIDDPNIATNQVKPEECTVCGGDRLKSKGYTHWKTYSVRRFICLSCGKQTQVKVN